MHQALDTLSDSTSSTTANDLDLIFLKGIMESPVVRMTSINKYINKCVKCVCVWCGCVLRLCCRGVVRQWICDETLSSEQVIRINGQVALPDAALTYLHFVLITDRLYRVSRDTCTEDEHIQLVPKSCWEVVFHYHYHCAHYH